MSKLVENSKKVKLTKVEDKWIVSKLNSLIIKVNKEMEEMHPHLATRALKDFWLNDLSRGYIQFVRDRLANEDIEAKYVLNEVYVTLVKLCAPIIPFTSESIWQDLKKNKIVKEESVHLSSWPKAGKIDVSLEEQFSIMFEVIESGLRERDKSAIGLKWPLASANVVSKKALDSKLLDLVKEQLNVKEVKTKVGNVVEVSLDTNITPELEAEGYARNLSRAVQALRKKSSLVKDDFIELTIVCDKDSELMLEDWEKFLMERTNAKKFSVENKFLGRGFADEEIKIKEKGFHIYLKKIN